MDEELIKQKIKDTIKEFEDKKFRRRELYNIVKEKNLEYDVFKQILYSLEKTGDVFRSKGRRFSIPEKTEEITGIFYSSRNGGGTVRLPDGDSYMINRSRSGEALTGDKVQIRILRKKKVGGSPAAEIIKILERSQRPLVGIFTKSGKTAFITPVQEKFAKRIQIANPEEFEVKSGDLVVTKVDESGLDERPFGRISEVLGDPDAPGVDVLSIIRRFQLSDAFPPDVITESENVPADLTPDILAKRKDIRDTVVFTIDPFDAKDFDDAISISRNGDKGFYLGVHIADVAHYVTPGSAMDREAQERTMSCYLVDRVIPMLPHRLSNDLCSLREKEDRLTKSVFFTIDEKGDITASEIANTVINSNMRLTYEQVQDYLDKKSTPETERITPEVGESLKLFSELADILIDRHTGRGALDIDLPEIKVMLDSEGKPVDIVRKERIKSNRMIEEAMLLANTVTAQALKDKGAVFLYRVHDKPDPLKLEAFGDVAKALGYDFNPGKAKNEYYIQEFLFSIQGKKHERTMSSLLLRSLKRAGYSPKNIGHYGLALETYAHFTSPIRRYPDLIVQRKLDKFILGRDGGADNNEFSFFSSLGDYITQRETSIDNAERESVKMKAAQFMGDHLGEEYTGTITGVMPNGLFVEIDQYAVEGLVHVSTLDDDYYELDKNGLAFTGKRKGTIYMIGDRVRILVASVYKERGEINFELLAKIKDKKK